MTDMIGELFNPTDPAPVDHVTLALAEGATLDRARRTITGRIVPFGVIANRTSNGPVLFAQGSIGHHPELRRIKLLLDHDQSRPVGYATVVDIADDGVTATFHLPEGAEGDDALAKAANGIRDGLSIGADVLMKHQAADRSHTIVTRARINEVSLVALPAFTDARVTQVTAATQPPGEPAMDDNETTEVETTQAPAQTALEPATVATDVAATLNRDTVSRIEASAARPPYQPATTAPVTVTAQMASQAIAAAAQESGNIRAQDIIAALADIVPASDAGKGYQARDEWLGELWSARRTATPLFDLFNDGRELTSMKLKGFRWVTRAEVDDYAGNKTEIPTNAVETEPAEVDAFRYAGGWDIDRIFVDLGNADMVEAVFRQAVESAGQHLEAKVTTALTTAATAVPAEDSLPEAIAAVGLEAATIGANVSTIQFAGDVWAQFLAMGVDALPWWVTAQTAEVNLGETSARVGNLTLSPNPALAAGTILAADRRAARARNKRVRVNAIDLPRGGIDLGVFGYAAILVEDARAIWSTSVTAAPEV